MTNFLQFQSDPQFLIIPFRLLQNLGLEVKHRYSSLEKRNEILSKKMVSCLILKADNFQYQLICIICMFLPFIISEVSESLLHRKVIFLFFSLSSTFNLALL